MSCKTCNTVIDADCVQYDDTKNLKEYLIDKELNTISTKSLSVKDLNKDEIIQLLIDEVIKLKKRVTDLETCESSDLCSLVDWSGLHSCVECNSTNSFCTHLQQLINQIKDIKEQLNV